MEPRAKAAVEFEDGAFIIDASVTGRGLNVESSLVPVRIREGRITVLREHGYDEDAGRYRLTFFYENRRFRLVVDEAGDVVQRFDSGFRRPPNSRFNAQTFSMTLFAGNRPMSELESHFRQLS